jgi:UDP-N-acetylmuramoyl-tripeptide--D-alanyl-D-alanine ligase
MGGQVIAPSGPLADTCFAGAACDSREVTPGRLFFALPGERTDGFRFCAQAAASGAAAIVIPGGRGQPDGCSQVPVIAVADPRQALLDLARAVRAEFSGKVVGITGSNGKTTTKELCVAALSSAGLTFGSPGNRNTDIGLPLAVLDTTGREAYWVLEMAMRAQGEIAVLAAVARPNVGLITNVATAHIGRLGSLEKVAEAKGELFHGLGDHGIAVFPSDEPLIEAQAAHLPEARKRRIGPTGVVRILDVHPDGARGAIARLAVGDTPLVVRLPLPGRHNVRNAAAALAVATALGVPAHGAAVALAHVTPAPHRSRLVSIARRTVLDDCYNANPASMAAALDTVASSAGAGQAFAVLGDMLELGPEADAAHAALGWQAAQHLAGLVTLGEHRAIVAAAALGAGMAVDRVVCAQSPSEAASTVAAWSAPGDWILVKASRGNRLERVVEALSSLLPGSAT